MRSAPLELLDVTASQATNITKILVTVFFNLSVTEPLIRVTWGSYTHRYKLPNGPRQETGLSICLFVFFLVLYAFNIPNKPAYMNYNMYFYVPILPGYVTHSIEILCTQNAFHSTRINNGSNLMLYR
jgi:ABC-type microcin C transport system permease subunit YejE